MDDWRRIMMIRREKHLLWWNYRSNINREGSEGHEEERGLRWSFFSSSQMNPPTELGILFLLLSWRSWVRRDNGWENRGDSNEGSQWIPGHSSFLRRQRWLKRKKMSPSHFLLSLFLDCLVPSHVLSLNRIKGSVKGVDVVLMSCLYSLFSVRTKKFV